MGMVNASLPSMSFAPQGAMRVGMRHLVPLLLTLLILCLAAHDMPAQHRARTTKRALTSTPGTKKRVKTKHSAHRRARHRRSPEESLAVLRAWLPDHEALYRALLRGDESVAVPETHVDASSPFADPRLRRMLIATIGTWLGTPYRHGGWSRRGADCSGYTSCLLSETLGETFRGDPRWQARQFTPIRSIDSLQFGDLVFFSGRNARSSRIGHVGVWLGNGVFTHSSSNHGVIFTRITEGYYLKRFRWGGRMGTAPRQP